jgi:hypothetical protein
MKLLIAVINVIVLGVVCMLLLAEYRRWRLFGLLQDNANLEKDILHVRKRAFAA